MYRPVQTGLVACHGPEMRNRQDILDQVKDLEISANSFDVNGHYLTWYTTPEELSRLAVEFAKDCLKPGEGTYAPGGNYGLSIYRPGWVCLEISTSSSYFPDVTLWIYPSVLKQAAKRLAESAWDKRGKGPSDDRWGYDSKTIKVRVGDDIISVVWVPEQDQNGTPQISHMVWDAYCNKTSREFALYAEEARRRESGMSAFPNDTVYGASA